jgi:predicted amidohydrolase
MGRLGPVVALGAVLVSSRVLGADLGAATPSRPGFAEAPPPIETVAHRRDALPRKVVIGTVLSGYDAIFTMPLEDRLARMDTWVDAMEAQAKAQYPGQRLDLVVLTEWFMTRPGKTLQAEAVRLADFRERAGACAARHGCYLVVPAVIREEGEPERYSNVAELFDRGGHLVGTYHKVHPATHVHYDNMEGGVTPGRSFPIFDCDFGRIGIQICYDVAYPDGWDALAREGAEIVAFPSETPESAHPSMYALLHRYYIVSATPKQRAAVYNPLGMIDAQVTHEGVLVHEIDLSYALTGWEPGLNQGESLKQRFGDRIGFTYSDSEDGGIYWSNDPKTTIGEMMRSFGYPEPQDDRQRIGELQDRLRGGPPETP